MLLKTYIITLLVIKMHNILINGGLDATIQNILKKVIIDSPKF